MAVYYHGDPRVLRAYVSAQDENSLLDWWFYSNRAYMEDIRREEMRIEEANKKGKGENKGGENKGGEKKEGGKKGGDKKEGDKKEGDKKEGDKKGGGEKKDDNKPKIIELMVPLCCESCAYKVKRKIEKLDGVEKPVICDMYEKKVTVKATAKPETVLRQARKVRKQAEMWPQKKK